LSVSRLALLVAIAARAVPAQSPAPAALADFFENRIRPVLVANCFGCHADTKTSGLRVDSREGMLKGGNSGPAIVPGDADGSLLVQAVSHSHARFKMPLGKKLADAEIEDLKAWIKAGAFWPEHAAAPVRIRATKITPEQRAFWSFRPLRKPATPAVHDTAWVTSDIDRFVLARLEEVGLKPAPPASKAALIRRVSFDLIGLPPAPEQLAESYTQVVDKLLASPHFGERWGRYWLDVARYGEDDIRGLSREPYPNAWRYRDWVVQAFNSDMPYDQFVKAQIAADLLPDKTNLAALGFFGLGPWYYDITVPPLARADERHDRVDALTRGFLGLTVACARCHNHKFDPITTADYYALAGVFASSEYYEYPLAPQSVVDDYLRRQERIQDQEKIIREYSQNFSAMLSEMLARQIAAYVTAAWKVMGPAHVDLSRESQARKLDRETLERWVEYLCKPDKDHPLLKGWDALVAGNATEAQALEFARGFQDLVMSILREKKAIDDENQALLAQHRPKKTSLKRLPNGYTSYDEFCPGCDVEIKALERDKYVLWNDLFGASRKERDKPRRGVLTYDEKQLDRWLDGQWKTHLENLRTELDALKKALPKQYGYVHGLAESQSPANLRIHVRGSPYSLGDEAQRQFPAVLCDAEPRAFSHGSGRLELAESIAAHPLTARVIANRVWEHLFGEGLVRTPSNFGRTGQAPTHPELLDWLAARLVEERWSIKSLIREIVLSSTYRLSSDYSEASYARDPDNKLLWRMSRRRLDAEALRDTLLFVSGSLDERVGGASVDLSKDTGRRTIYGKVSRFKLNETLALFDFPSPGTTSEKRNVTNVPLQRLFYLNDELVASRAGALAAKVAQWKGRDEARIERLYPVLFSRPASPSDVALGLEFLRESRGGDAAAWKQYVQVLLMSNEFSFID
jgi:cytochrome c553